MAEKISAKKKLTRSQQRELDVEIGFIEGVVRRAPDYVEALQILGDDYTKRGKYVAGLKVDQQLAELRPEDPMVHYNLACSFSLTGDIKKAVASLEKAIELGYRDFKWLGKDPDLVELRKSPFFKTLQARIKKLQSKGD
jgi:tetratricopeptide (TPR) repeat protein